MRNVVVRLTPVAGEPIVLGIDGAGRWASPDAAWERIDVGDGVAMPGLVDAHAHLTSADTSHMNGATDHLVADRIAAHAAAQLDAGVLLVADKGTHLPASVALTLDLAPAQRPEVQLAGRFLANPGGYYHRCAIEVEPPGLVTAMDEATPPGATWVKVIGDWPRRGLGAIPNFDEKALFELAAAAHARGLRTAIHTAAPETPSLAVRAGIDSIEHGLFLTEDDVAMLGARRGAWVPTVAAMERLAAQLGPASSGGRLIAEGLDNVRTLLAAAVAAGVAVMAGTDLAVDHGAVYLEVERLTAYGLTAEQAVAAVTTVPRQYLGVPGFVVGSPADFIVVDAAASVAALASPRLVVRCGRIVTDAR